eukprot:12813565-Alexandrium_andersonii.AAC.1
MCQVSAFGPCMLSRARMQTLCFAACGQPLWACDLSPLGLCFSPPSGTCVYLPGRDQPRAPVQPSAGRG